MKKQLISVQEKVKDGFTIPVVDARELHSFLLSQRHFNDWFQDRVQKYGLSEGTDFYTETCRNKSQGRGRPAAEYLLVLDVAKELAMVEDNAQGKQARLYFIEVEKHYQKSLQVHTSAEALLESVRILVSHEQRLNSVEYTIAQIVEDKTSAIKTLMALPPADGPAKEKTKRSMLNERVRAYAQFTGVPYGRVWKDFYRQVLYRFRVNLVLRARNRKSSSLDVAESLGLVNELYDLACEVFPVRESS